MNTAQTAPASSPVINFATDRADGGQKTLTQTRDALPFYKKSTGKTSACWWSVTPSSNYAADIETGKSYAHDFLPMLSFNGGAAALGWIVEGMAVAGGRSGHAIDAIATGFMLQIGGSLQSAIVSIAIAGVALQDREKDMGDKLVAMINGGGILHGSSRSALHMDPGALIFFDKEPR